MTTRWRVGRRVPRNIYRDDEPIAMLATPEIAAEIVAGMNDVERLRAALEAVNNADCCGCSVYGNIARAALSGVPYDENNIVPRSTSAKPSSG
jgi:hypothetical protein